MRLDEKARTAKQLGSGIQACLQPAGVTISGKEKSIMSAKIPFSLAGFTQQGEFRVFTFERPGADRTRTKYTVRADLALVRKYDIQVQELPLLCRSLLESRDDSEDTRGYTFTEEAMRLHADSASARRAEAQKKRPPRRPSGFSSGSAWRGHQSAGVPGPPTAVTPR
jgi:hypothetical protein